MGTARTMRRAAERRAKKLAFKQERLAAENPHFISSEDVLDIASEDTLVEETLDTAVEETLSCSETAARVISSPATLSQGRLEANRANAQKSTGPKTEDGKAKSCKNALRTALTGRTVLLPGDDAERYSSRLDEYFAIYKPVGVRELEIVQLLADTWWRLERIPGLIEAVYAKGCEELLDKVSHLDGAARRVMLRAEAYIAYERQFRNLELQERRLFRQSEKLREELAGLQKERIEREARDYAEAAMLYLAAKKDRKPFDPAELGFEFSIADIEGYLHGARARSIAEEAAKNGEINPKVIKQAA